MTEEFVIKLLSAIGAEVNDANIARMMEHKIGDGLLTLMHDLRLAPTNSQLANAQAAIEAEAGSNGGSGTVSRPLPTAPPVDPMPSPNTSE